jgi:hypothetical protein
MYISAQLDYPKKTCQHCFFRSGEDDAVDNALRVSEVNCFERVLRFYEAPFTKFVTNIVSYLLTSF